MIDVFIIKATTPIEEFNHYFKADLPLEDVETLGGLAAKSFGYLPKRGEKIDIFGFHFTVMHADNRRIRLLKLLLAEPMTTTSS